MHTLILFTRSRLQGHNFFTEYVESLQEVVLKKICRTVKSFLVIM